MAFKRLLALVIVALWPAVLLATPASGLELVYEINVGGFSMGVARVQTTVGNGAYRLRTNIETAGLVGWLTGFSSLAASDGVLAVEGPRPRTHRAESLWMGDKRWSEQRFRPGLPVAGGVFPDVSADGREPVAPGLTVDTVDPLTAGLTLSGIAAIESGKPHVIPVFDGRRRYDLIVTPAGAETVTTPHYAGRAQVVEVALRRVAGFSPSPFFPPPKEGEKARIWFAPAHVDLPGHGVPVRLQADGPLGAVVVNLVRLEHPRLTAAP